MQKLFLAVGVSSLALASFCSAQAADPVRRAHHGGRGVVPTIATNRYVPIRHDFNGPYAGLSALYNGSFGEKAHHNAGGSIFAGYNVEDSCIMYGVEGDVRYTVPVLAHNIHSLHGIGGSLRIRGGYEVSDSLLLYATVGPDVAQKYETGKAGEITPIAIGGTAGVGVEVGGLSESLVARLEYRASKYSKVEGFYNTISLGVGMKF